MELGDIAAVIIIISVLVGAAYLIYLATKDTKEILSIHDYKPNSEKNIKRYSFEFKSNRHKRAEICTYCEQ